MSGDNAYCELTIGSVTHKLSTEWLTDTSEWLGKLKMDSPPQSRLDFEFGGMHRFKIGDISISPDFFLDTAGVWPPPFSLTVDVYFGETEATKTHAFNAVCYRKEIGEFNIKYAVISYESEATVTAGAISDTLVNVFDNYCDSSLGLTLDSTLARSTSPSVSFTVDTEQNLLQFMSEMAAYFTHMFYIDTQTSKLYLVDMFNDNGTRQLVERDMFRTGVSYRNKLPVSSAVVDTDARFSSYPMGRTINLSKKFSASPNDDLDNIISICNLEDVTTVIPIDNTYGVPAPQERITWVDSLLYIQTNATMNVHGMKIDFNADQLRITVSGKGTVDIGDAPVYTDDADGDVVWVDDDITWR
jgi:hypothetical protein